jgi:trk system potassium uptake protein TrkA
LYPERQVASWAAIRYTSDHIADYVELDEDHGIYEVEIPAHWQGKTLRELDVRNKYNINIFGYKREGRMSLSVKSNTKLEPGITLMAIGTYDDIRRCFHI